MKNLVICFLVFCAFISLSAQEFEVDTILYNGDIDNHLNIVVLGDGYVASELDKFSGDAVAIKNALFNEVPYSNYENYFNVFAIRVPSNESGASHPGDASDVSEPAHPVKVVDNYFGSTFDAFGIHRLLIPENSQAIFNVLAINFPQFDQVIVLTNSTYYGGSGGQFATSSLNVSAPEIAIHEMGHSFAFLIDEYYAGDQYSREGINMSAETDSEKVRWKNWVGFKEVGIYQHCCSGDAANWYRPHEDCKMRFLGPDFCPVCIEGTIESIHSLVPAVVGFSPEEKSLTVEDLPMVFKVDLTKPMPNTLAVNWSINGGMKSGFLDSIMISTDDLDEGLNEILVTVEDQSTLLRVDGHEGVHMDFVLWEVSGGVSGTDEIAVEQNKIKIDLYPNPTQDYIVFESKSTTDRPVIADLYTPSGVKVKTLTINNGRTTKTDISALLPGTYFVHFRMGKNRLASSKIVKH